jgi:hypothetical protein
VSRGFLAEEKTQRGEEKLRLGGGWHFLKGGGGVEQWGAGGSRPKRSPVEARGEGKGAPTGKR